MKKQWGEGNRKIKREGTCDNKRAIPIEHSDDFQV